MSPEDFCGAVMNLWPVRITVSSHAGTYRRLVLSSSLLVPNGEMKKTGSICEVRIAVLQWFGTIAF